MLGGAREEDEEDEEEEDGFFSTAEGRGFYSRPWNPVQSNPILHHITSHQRFPDFWLQVTAYRASVSWSSILGRRRRGEAEQVVVPLG